MRNIFFCNYSWTTWAYVWTRRKIIERENKFFLPYSVLLEWICGQTKTLEIRSMSKDRKCFLGGVMEFQSWHCIPKIVSAQRVFSRNACSFNASAYFVNRSHSRRRFRFKSRLLQSSASSLHTIASKNVFHQLVKSPKKKPHDSWSDRIVRGKNWRELKDVTWEIWQSGRAGAGAIGWLLRLRGGGAAAAAAAAS